jgi:arginine exporter protein ArgO
MTDVVRQVFAGECVVYTTELKVCVVLSVLCFIGSIAGFGLLASGLEVWKLWMGIITAVFALIFAVVAIRLHYRCSDAKAKILEVLESDDTLHKYADALRRSDSTMVIQENALGLIAARYKTALLLLRSARRRR